MGLEGRELPSPEPFRLLEPGLERGHRCWSQAVDPDPRVEGRVGLLDQADLAQAAEMPAHGRRAQPRRLGELARPARPFAQQVDDPPTMRIGECREDAVESRRCLQAQPSIFKPLAFSASCRDTRRTVWPKLQTWPSGSRAA